MIVRRYLPESGFTVVEMMISVTISLLLLIGLVELMVGNKQSFNTREEMGVLQGGARHALSVLGRDLEMVGHWGGIDSGIENLATGTVTGVGGCDEAWALDVDTPIRGYEGAADITGVDGLPSNCVAASHYVPQSDLVVVRFAQGDHWVPSALVTSPPYDGRIFFRSVAGVGGALFLGADDIPTDLPDQDGAYNYPYVVALYYLRPCRVVTAAGCSDGVPTLVRLTLSDTSLVEEAVVEGVEQLQFSYGVDSDRDGAVEGYVDASAVKDWQDVISVRFGLIVRSEKEDDSITDTAVYDLPGEFTWSPSQTDAGYARKKFVQTIKLRNML